MFLKNYSFTAGTTVWMILMVLSALSARAEKPIPYKITKDGDGWKLLREGEPFYIKGAVGWSRHDLLTAYGANSVRIRAHRRSLDMAAENGLAAMVNLPVRGERNGMDWGDEAMVAEQKENVLAVVREFKVHPAVMFWSVGNELDHIPGGQAHHPGLWRRLNDLGRAIAQIDPIHPVMTVVGSGRFENKIQRIAAECPDFDLIGFNTYGDIAKVAEWAEKYYDGPYVFSEWGPTGHWQRPKTPWRVPYEQTSSEKARVIYERYRDVILANRVRCLGSYVFYWSEKQETTHSWYGLFRDGLETESIGVMKYYWSGTWPENRAPAVLAIGMEGFAQDEPVFLEPGKEKKGWTLCHDPEFDELVYRWDIRKEVRIPANSYAGGGEKPEPPIEGLIIEGDQAEVRFKTPAEPGPYRLFIQVEDGRGHAGYGNLPFHVGPIDR